MRTWAIGAAALIPVAFASAIISTLILDTLMIRPTINGGSVNTLLPGTTYAMATIMKVCIAESLVLLIIWAAIYVRSRWFSVAHQLTVRSASNWTIASLNLPPIAILLGALAVMVSQSLSVSPDSADSFTYFSRAGVFTMMACLFIAIAVSAIAIVKRDAPAVVNIIIVIAIAVLIALFWYFEFYAIGFDQDLWAPKR